jgi:HEAT repeat protein
MLDNALDALKKYNWGTDMAVLDPIEQAAIAAHDNAQTRQDLEHRLIALLKQNISRDAEDYICRKLSTIGTAAAVPTLAGLLGSQHDSHMARYALQRITDPEAAGALRHALDKVGGPLKIGVISSLGARRDAESVAPLGSLLQDDDPAIARAAALALGAIGNASSVAALQAALRSATANKETVIDALLSCAESLLRGNNQADAASIYKSLSGDQSRLVRLAATRGLLACAAKQG